MNDEEREKGKSFTVGGFYGARHKRKCIGIERSVENAVKKHQSEKIPKAFPSRILGPCTKWLTFYRQQDAFIACRSADRDLHVFAFESDYFDGNTGQRMYLVVSYPVFWHYYRQLEQEKKHHYEVIPQGAICKLYFDLEFDKTVNPDRDGNTMVDILIKIMSTALEKEFNLRLSRSDVLDLEASTEKKFSRHLVFQTGKTLFKNNVHAGNFVSSVMTAILHRLNMLDKTSKQDVKRSEQANKSNTEEPEMGLKENENSDENMMSSDTKTHPQLACTDSQSEINIQDDTFSHSCDSSHIKTDNLSMALNGKIVAVDADLDLDNMRGDMDVKTDPKCSVDLLGDISNDELQEMIVKNKHEEDVLFCDTGVYTKNRNFRLYLSSKMNKNNPLQVADQNSYRPKPNTKYTSEEEAIFFDSLVTNVVYNQSTRVLTFGTDTDKQFSHSSGHRAKVKEKESIDGFNKSPYPEVDAYITSLITQNGSKGVIRHWTYFHLGELLLYEISHYRFCHNIGRQHRSNNIMYVVDLRKGIFYQKCHDPDCHMKNYKSEEWDLPRDVLPESFFTDDMDDFEDLEMDDEELLNTTLELEKRYQSGREHRNSPIGSSQLEDGDDNYLLDAAGQLENSLIS